MRGSECPITPPYPSPVITKKKRHNAGMTLLTMIALRTALDAERELLRCLAEKEPTFVEFSNYLLQSVSPYDKSLSQHQLTTSPG